MIGNPPSWSWIGEAKIYNSISDLKEGFLQLTTRYRNTDPTNVCGGLLAYTFRDLVVDRMGEWKEAVSMMGLRNFNVYPCESRGALGFTSVHDHTASGLPYEIRHLGVCLHFSPQDRSGRKAKRYRKPESASN